MASKVLTYILEHPDSWVKDLQNLGVRVKNTPDMGLVMLNYMGLDCDFSNPLVAECRGLLLDLQEHKVVSWAFNKFGNYHESYAADIDWKSAKAQEKLDGSIIKCYFYRREWHWATNSCSLAEDAPLNDNMNYLDLIKMAKNYNKVKDMIEEKGNKDYTYIFELCDPWNHVVKYPYVCLYFIGARNVVTGLEANPREVFPEMSEVASCPAQFSVSSLEDCVKAAEGLNKNETVTQEGFVVVDKYFNRVKVKNMVYLFAHKMKNNKTLLTVKDFVKGDYIVKDLTPELLCQHKYYEWQAEEIYVKADQIALYARVLFEEYSHDKKAVALALKDKPLSSIGFMALNNDKVGRELVTDKILLKNIKPYGDAAAPV